ncbi:tetratricopeptide repeat protein, partial [Pseudomonadota bacterium]|nr:tetratricopeptide repeat protein [Pseudomonadota bacterium]
MLAKLSIDQTLMKASSHVKRNEILEAQKLYQAVLLAFPQNIRAQEGLDNLNNYIQNNIKQSLPKLIIDQLINLYNQGHFSVIVEKVQVLKEKYQDQFLLWDILGASTLQMGRLDDAIWAYKNAILLNPNHSDSYFNLGNILRDQGRMEEAIEAYNKCILFKPNDVDVFFTLGNILKDQGKLDEAVKAFKKCILLKPNYAAAYSNMGNALKDQGKLDEALEAQKKSIELMPNYADDYNNLGITLQCQGKLDKAIDAYKKALLLKPDYALAYSNMGNSLKDQGKLDEALEAHKKSIELMPNHAEVYNNIGITLKNQGKLEEAIDAYNKALSLKPNYTEAYSNMGNALKDQGNFDEALEAHKKSIELIPNYVQAYINIGNVLSDQGIFDQAIIFYNQALSIRPDYAEAYNNIGVALKEQRKLEEAINALKKAILLKPNYAEAYRNMGNIYRDLGQLEKGIDAYEKALTIKPNYEIARAEKLYELARICDWDVIKKDGDLIPLLGTTHQFITPFSLLSLEDAPERHRIRSKIYAEARYLQNSLPFPNISSKTPGRIRIGYFSADFKEHPVGYLIAKVIEQHNRDKFEIFGYSLVNKKEDELQKQFTTSFDVFNDVSKISDKNVALMSRNDNIDIAIDLTGYTENSRSAIFAYRAAPIQINYLGYPGTLGADHIDYIVTDQYVVPPENQKYFTEKQIYLPNTYMPTDNTREISTRYISKKEFNLTEGSFVFCCFNNSYKITSKEFDIWMRLLNKVEKSVLWLR